ncbi:MAG: pyridoxal 5'-phosphate synthase glutaminase subunit PdxT [Chloroflexi bacterium]|nr:MAG: pyridoxal 5'-phosphate synthase glutaminase subunit PdxT [Chloroflexota bacterium]
MSSIGVLALQGDFREHISALRELGARAFPVRLPADLEGVDGLIIPGGESTVMGKLMIAYGLDQPLRRLVLDGLPVWGTCAGLILLSRETENALDGQPLLAAMNIRTRRNAFGPQRASFETMLEVPVLGKEPFHAVFIRGPVIDEAGENVEVLSRLTTEGDSTGPVVAVRQGSMLGTAFHPEITGDTRFHDYFLGIVREQVYTQQ